MLYEAVSAKTHPWQIAAGGPSVVSARSLPVHVMLMADSVQIMRNYKSRASILSISHDATI